MTRLSETDSVWWSDESLLHTGLLESCRDRRCDFNRASVGNSLPHPGMGQALSHTWNWERAYSKDAGKSDLLSYHIAEEKKDEGGEQKKKKKKKKKTREKI